MIPANSKVALFIPCFTEQLFPETGMALARLLKHFGLNPIYVPGQSCCGQPASNSGRQDLAAPLAERFLRLFEPYDWIVAPSGSCVSMVKIGYGELDLSPTGRALWVSLRERLFEGTQFLYHKLEIQDFPGRYEAKIALHESCHGKRELGVDLEPKALLSGIAGLELIIPPLSDECCGFGGTFAVKFPELSAAMGGRKLAAIQKTGAQIITAIDDSCLMHLHGLARRRGMEIKTMHVLRVLAKAMNLG
jgi:L-lactate dehydrogenase complex protein LldE